MPPEQARGRTDEVDALSDLWAVGATMFALLSGRIVHDAKTHMEVVIAAATAQAKSLGAVAPDAPKALVEVVDRALAFNKAERWPSARAMQQALRAAFPIAAARTSVSWRRPATARHPAMHGSEPPVSLGLGARSRRRRRSAAVAGRRSESSRPCSSPTSSASARSRTTSSPTRCASSRTHSSSRSRARSSARAERS